MGHNYGNCSRCRLPQQDFVIRVFGECMIITCDFEIQTPDGHQLGLQRESIKSVSDPYIPFHHHKRPKIASQLTHK